MTKKTPLAIAYDFDGTLAPGNMQDHIFIPAIGMSKKAFCAKVKDLSEKNEADNILIYMELMLQKAAAENVPVRKSDFKKYGKDLPLFSGVTDWFGRITIMESSVAFALSTISSLLASERSSKARKFGANLRPSSHQAFGTIQTTLRSHLPCAELHHKDAIPLSH